MEVAERVSLRGVRGGVVGGKGLGKDMLTIAGIGKAYRER